MYRVIYIIFRVFILLWNNVEITSLTQTTQASTTIVSTSFANSEDEESMTVKDNLSTTATTFMEEFTTSTPFPIDDYWMTQMGVINDELLRIQAIIVKDEDAEKGCIEGNQKSKKRYLMCAGSILNRNRVLTSASCLHEAAHIRHNVQARLAVIIAPLKSTVQMIRVTEWVVHPLHDTNPHGPNYLKHNLAILNLACRISSNNYHKIDLPTEAMTHICTEGNCFIAVYRKTSYTSNVIYQIPAPQIPFHERSRRDSNVYTPAQVNLDDISTGSNSSHDISKIIDKRSSDGSNGCSQAGAAVMINTTQTAIVAVSCDDRQSSGKWGFTDLYRNLNWIHSILNDWNKTEIYQILGEPNVKAAPNHTISKGCGNCIFNFYISVGCKEKGNCPKTGINGPIKLSPPIPNDNHPSNVQLNNMNRMQVQNIQSPWRRGQVSSNDIPRLLRSSYEQCPNNSPQCMASLAEINNEQRPIHFDQVPIFKGLELPNKKIDRFEIDPMLMNAKKQSHLNGLAKYNMIYRKNDGVINSSNKVSRLFRTKPDKFTNTLQKMYTPLNVGRNKHIQNDMSNWLRRRQAIGPNTYRNM